MSYFFLLMTEIQNVKGFYVHMYKYNLFIKVLFY